MKNTKIIPSSISKYQMPLFMITKEYYDAAGDVEFAEVLFSTDNIFRWIKLLFIFNKER